jgi:Domain of unknown function (DUF4114)/FG-GAP repeat
VALSVTPALLSFAVICCLLLSPKFIKHSKKQQYYFTMSEQFFDLSTLNSDSNKGFTIVVENDDQLGLSVSDAGDLNGDRIGDIVIGAPLSDPNNKSNSGKTYVVFGSKDGFDQTINLSTLDGTKGFVINGSEEGDESGRSVSNIGDINADGVDDLAIGAPFSNMNGDNSGASYVIFGSKESNYFSNPIELSNLDPSKGFTIKGIQSSDSAGWAVSSAGDFNGDHIKDLLIGATSYDQQESGIKGESYIIFGKDGNFGSTLDLSNIDGLGLKIISDQPNSLGYSVSDAGDINNDGANDLIIGAPYADPDPDGHNSGSSFVIYGRKSDNPFTDGIINVTELNSNDGFTINGQDADKSGFFVSKAGDINGDGFDDLIIGANDGNPDSKEFAGRTYVVFGKDGNFGDTLELANLDGNNGFVINGIKAFDNSGWSVSALGDINSDGIDDIIIGANNGGTASAGQSYVIYGNNDGFSATFDLSSLDGENGFIINGLDEGGNLGNSVSGAGDVNDDGVNDLIVSAPFVNSGAGAAYIVFGEVVNQNPTGLELNNNSIDENVNANSIIGSLSTTDSNKKDTFTYSLVAGEGDTDNNAFTIDGDKLTINNSPDYEAKNSYSLLVRTTDNSGLNYDKQFTITINNLDETAANQAPTGLELNKNSIDENVDANSVIGSLTTTDPEQNDTFIYTFVTGDGDADNNAFTIDGDKLKIKASPDFETKSNYNIRVKTQDAAGLTYEKALTININDINEIGSDSGSGSNSFLTKISDDVFNIKGNNAKATLEVTLTGRSSSLVNEIGVFTVDNASGSIDGIDPGAADYAEKALAKSQVIFTTLANPPAGFDPTSLDRLLGFNSNDNLRFYLVKGGSTESVLNNTTSKENILFPSPSNLKITDLGSDSFSLDWEDGSGNPTGFEDLQIKIQGTDKAIPIGTSLQNKPQGELLDLQNTTGQVKAEFVVNREAGYNNFVGFYRVVDKNGGIDTNGDGNADILPGQADYAQAALNGRVSDLNLTVNNGGTAAFNGTLQGGAIYVPFLIANGTPDTSNPNIYFTFLGANSDGVDHVRMLGDNTFGFEDLLGGGDKDFNDMVVKVNLTATV